MRTVRLRGGLGNQMFGLAFAHSLGHLTGAPVAIDVSGFSRDRHRRAFMTADLAADLGLSVGSGRPPLFSGRVRESRAPVDIAALARLGHYFDGYWHDEDYIADPVTIRARTRAFLDVRGGRAAAHDIVIHHRAYREEPFPARRRGPSPDYVARAIDLIERRQGATADIVSVSDDPPGADPFADMTLMLNARALILANSSFSWWAGYCGDATTVTYPERGGAFHYPAPAARFMVV